MTYNIKPSGDKIAVIPKDLTKVAEGQFVIPNVGRDNFLTGEVIAVGPGRISEFSNKLIKPTHQVGDLVAYQPTAGARVIVNKIEYIILPDTHILCVIEPVKE